MVKERWQSGQQNFFFPASSKSSSLSSSSSLAGEALTTGAKATLPAEEATPVGTTEDSTGAEEMIEETTISETLMRSEEMSGEMKPTAGS